MGLLPLVGRKGRELQTFLYSALDTGALIMHKRLIVLDYCSYHRAALLLCMGVGGGEVGFSKGG